MKGQTVVMVTSKHRLDQEVVWVWEVGAGLRVWIRQGGKPELGPGSLDSPDARVREHAGRTCDLSPAPRSTSSNTSAQGSLQHRPSWPPSGATTQHATHNT